MYRWVDHTAEVELALESPSEHGVFADALAALAELLGFTPGGDPACGRRRTVTVSADDRAALLAGWLEELVFLAETEGFVPTRLADLKLAPAGLSADVEGVLGAPPPLVKAVTLHRLMFEPGDAGYVARVVLDVELALRRLDSELWEVPMDAVPGMRVPGRLFADEELLAAIARDHSLEQLANVATLPGIVEASLAMPDIHQGYGFPVGGVAATAERDGVISPGGVGYDINCGVRLLALPLAVNELGARRQALVHEFSRNVPVGAGGRGAREGVAGAKLERVLSLGPRALLEDLEIGSEADLTFTESGGRLEGADPAAVSARARERGTTQIGTLGSGNHFLELQQVERVYDEPVAQAFGLRPGQLTVLIHSGSRGLGHQVCTDFVKRMDAKLAGYGIALPDRQLSCAPIGSPDGQAYLAAMAAAANFAWANRAAIAHRVRQSIARVLGRDVARQTCQVYDVAHNVAKLEQHGGRTVCVHRKGATRAFPPGHPEIPAQYGEAGQPVFIPGSMGTASFVLAGREGSMRRSFGTTCHGAGRRLSRTAVRKAIDGGALRRRLEAEGIVVRAASARGLAEEAPEAYKDVDRVVEVVERAGLAARVARLRPLGVVKG